MSYWFGVDFIDASKIMLNGKYISFANSCNNMSSVY